MEHLEQMETSRLLLVRLDRSWMERFSQNPQETARALEAALSLSPSERAEHPSSAYLYACSEMRRLLYGENSHEEKWLCFWEIIEKETRRRIGGLLFKGPPDENRAVEIGYGIDGDFRRRGYGLEAVEEGIRWAFSQGAKTVIAKVNPGNIPSRRLLERAGMVQYQMIGKMPCYRVCSSGGKTDNERKDNNESCFLSKQPNP